MHLNQSKELTRFQCKMIELESVVEDCKITMDLKL